MDSPSIAQSLQDAGDKSAAPVNNDINGVVSFNSGAVTVIDCIDLDEYDEKSRLQDADDKSAAPVNKSAALINKSAAPVNNSGEVTVIDCIDLGEYEEKTELLRDEIMTLCQRLQTKSESLTSQGHLSDQIEVFKKIGKIFSRKIKEETVWKYIFRKYTRVTQTFSDVSIIIAIISLIIAIL